MKRKADEMDKDETWIDWEAWSRGLGQEEKQYKEEQDLSRVSTSHDPKDVGSRDHLFVRITQVVFQYLNTTIPVVDGCASLDDCICRSLGRVLDSCRSFQILHPWIPMGLSPRGMSVFLRTDQRDERRWAIWDLRNGTLVSCNVTLDQPRLLTLFQVMVPRGFNQVLLLNFTESTHEPFLRFPGPASGPVTNLCTNWLGRQLACFHEGEIHVFCLATRTHQRVKLADSLVAMAFVDSSFMVVFSSSELSGMCVRMLDIKAGCLVEPDSDLKDLYSSPDIIKQLQAPEYRYCQGRGALVHGTKIDKRVYTDMGMRELVHTSLSFRRTLPDSAKPLHEMMVPVVEKTESLATFPLRLFRGPIQTS